MFMRLTCGNGSKFIGVTKDNHTVVLYEWHNSWLLYKHIHWLRLQRGEEYVLEPIAIDTDD